MDLAVPREIDSPAVIADEVGGETLIINLNTGTYYVVPPAGLLVWTAVSSGVPAAALVADGDAERLAAMTDYMQRLLAAGLLRDATAAADGLVEWEPGDLLIEEHTDMADLLGLDPIHDADENVGWPMAPKE